MGHGANPGGGPMMQGHGGPGMSGGHGGYMGQQGYGEPGKGYMNQGMYGRTSGSYAGGPGAYTGRWVPAPGQRSTQSDVLLIPSICPQLPTEPGRAQGFR